MAEVIQESQQVSQQPAPQAQVVTQPTTQSKPNQQTDVIDRVNKFMQSNDPSKLPQVDGGDDFDIKQLDSIADPTQREILKKGFNSLRNGFNKKYMTLAEETKAVRELKQQLESQIREKAQDEGWTPQRVQSLLNRPDFVQSAQAIIGNGQTSDDYLTEEQKQDRARVSALEREIANLKSMSSEAVWNQQHTILKQKFPEYDSNAVDTIRADFLAGKVQAGPEHLWKVHDYDHLIKRMESKVRAAYEMGRQDERGGVQEKINSNSYSGINVNPSEDVPVREKDESSKSYFTRIGLRNLINARNKQVIR